MTCSLQSPNDRLKVNYSIDDDTINSIHGEENKYKSSENDRHSHRNNQKGTFMGYV